MKAAAKQKWLKALRSGEYRKSRQQLYVPERKEHCCLGVLRDLVGTREPDSYGMLVPKTLTKVGLTRQEERKLIALNDSHGGWVSVCEYIETSL